MAIWDDPVLNSAFREPRQYYELDAKGVPTGAVIEKRRTSQHLVPIPPPKKTKKQA